MADIHEIVRKCEGSRTFRKDRYGFYRLWYSRGTDQNGPPALFNKLKSHIRLLMSYLYAPDSTRFHLVLPTEDRSEWLEHSVVARDEFRKEWRDTGTDIMVGNLILWALVYGAAGAKILPKGEHGFGARYLYPGDLGVLREDIPYLDDQEVIVHWSAMTLAEVKRWSKGHPKEKEIIAYAEREAKPGAGSSDEYPQILQDVVATNLTGTFPNQTVTGITNLTMMGDERPHVDEPLIQFAEVWERCDYKRNGHAFSDYLVSTVIGDWTVFERRNPILPYTENPGGDPLPAELPFTLFVPRPIMDFIWGESELNDVIQLQALHELRMRQVDQLTALQLDPPRVFIGIPIPDEKLNALKKAGSMIAIPGANSGKMEVLKPEGPANPYQHLEEINKMFADAVGINELLQGQSQSPNVRAGSQVGQLANISVGRVREQALVIEDAIEILATRVFHLLQRRDDTAYALPSGEKFLLSQIPAGATMKVSAHTSSPVYQDQLKQDAQVLLKAGAIDLPTFVELMNPPGVEALTERSRALAKQKAEQSRELIQIQHEKAQKKAK